MRCSTGLAAAAALVGIALAQDSDPAPYSDTETGLKYASYTNDAGIVYRIAVPSAANVTANTDYDLVIQVVAPVSVGWAGIAWGGAMTYNPLTVGWANGNAVVVSSREAVGYFTPAAYTGATYTLLPGGSHVNSTYWQYTAKCSGCAYFGDDDTGITWLDPTQQNYLAYAYAATPPDTPAKNDSSFGIHDNIGHWVHDFSIGQNDHFADIVAKDVCTGDH